MRIAIITENFLPKVDGVTRTLARLLEHLETTSHQVLLLGPETNKKTYAGAQLIGTFGIPFILYPELKINLWRPKFTTALIQFQPDIIHLVDPVCLGALGLSILRYYLPTIPIVSSYHTNLADYCRHFGFGFLSSTMWKWNRYCHSFSHAVACPSKSTSITLKEHGFNNIKIWPRGVDMSFFSPGKRSSQLRSSWSCAQKTVILYVGRISYEKNIHLLIDAYKQMNHDVCHLVLVGHGPAFGEIQSVCQSSDIPVTFTGYLQGKDLSQVYASADIFAFPSTSETFGQVVLEAMASGLPVIGLEAEGVKDLVQHGRTGLLLNPEGLTETQQMLAYRELLQSIVTQRQWCDKLSEESIRQAQQYTWFDAMACMVQVYHDALPYSKQVIEVNIDSGVESDYA
ncbi:glycosyl transferase group 1 [Mucor mucedo]|uniref:glycosyl transferase group 1 n=1 Tax=Mucor mucedo TaxID=29922 RepID=UPI00221F8556|nr:glycosyl transferase group 1 [Mucor mucedo]KAI7893769.1 glycosyl transferase group 1 [Mucor mucedo]